jgi:hypothetical protein
MSEEGKPLLTVNDDRRVDSSQLSTEHLLGRPKVPAFFPISLLLSFLL